MRSLLFLLLLLVNGILQGQSDIQQYVILEMDGERIDYPFDGDSYSEAPYLFLNGQRIYRGYAMPKKFAFLAEYLELSLDDELQDRATIYSAAWGKDVLSHMHFAIQRFLEAGWELQGNLQIKKGVYITSNIHVIQVFIKRKAKKK